MLIREVILKVTEGYYEDLIVAVQNELAKVSADPDKDEIETEDLQRILADQGYEIEIEDLIQAVDDGQFASSVDKNVIKPKGELPADIDTEEEPSVDVAKMAGNQAMKDIKAEL
jgi:hypothetical protein